MIFRFSLYGFLKNQRYFDPFLVLVLLEKGFSFFLIGLLIAFREIVVNLLEIPSGAIADACGRRGSMMLSFASYIVSFLLFGLARGAALIFVAMFFFAIGDAFRTGTHKAMIFEWLRLEGRMDERTRVYGYTRSWSKIGSAVSSLLAAIFVIVADSYTTIFYIAIVPYVLSLVNFLGYPKELDGQHDKARSAGEIWRRLKESLVFVVRERPLRRLVGESMGWEGVFNASKDYLQPALQAAVLAGWATIALPDLGWSETQRTAVLVGPVYFVLFLLAATASRQAHRVASAAGSEAQAARALWAANAAVCLVLTWAAYREIFPLVVASFVGLYALQNFWRPILVSRFDACSRTSQGATVLSIESQAHRAGTIVVAPLLGWAVDTVRLHGVGGELWPVGAVGAAVALWFVMTSGSSRD